MTSDPRMTAILEELAAGRIDAGEAARRIDALKTPSSPGSPVEGPQDSGAEPTNE